MDDALVARIFKKIQRSLFLTSDTPTNQVINLYLKGGESIDDHEKGLLEQYFLDQLTGKKAEVNIRLVNGTIVVNLKGFTSDEICDLKTTLTQTIAA